MQMIVVLALGGLSLLTACSGGADDAASMDMTPEEHARMLSGGQGQVDSLGVAVREPVHLTPAQELALGVVYITAEERTLERTIRTVGRVSESEDAVADVTLKVDGFIEDLLVSTTGESVRRGQPLLTLYSPELVAAQEELLTAMRLAERVDPTAEEAWRGSQQMLEAARRRLTYWDITAEQIEYLERTGQVSKALTIVAPVSGIVLEKTVLQGQQVMTGMRLYRIADLTGVWVEGDVFEQDLQFVQVGDQAHIEVAAYPGEHFMGDVSFVYPTVDTESRTNRVRVTIDNPDLRFKPGMFATMFFDIRMPDALSVPLEAVLVTGERNLVFIRDDEGMLRPREVVLGPQAGDYVKILAGLAAGERIVGSANFLVDAESRLGGTERAMPGTQHGAREPEDSAGVTEHQHD